MIKLTPQKPPYYENIPQLIKYQLKALLTQTGTAHPVVNMLQNTFPETPTITRSGVGQYLIQFTQNLLPEDKTALNIQQVGNLQVQAIIGYADNTLIVIQTGNGTTLTDALLMHTTIEITIYN